MWAANVNEERSNFMGKIAMFLPSLRGGGAERVMTNLAQGFVLRGYAVDLLLCQKQGPYLQQVPPSIRIIDLKSRRVLLALPKLIRYLRTHKPLAMLCAMDHTNIVGVWAYLLAGVPTKVIVTVHANPNDQTKSNFKMKVIRLLIRYFYRHAHAVVAVSAGVRDALARLTGLDTERIRVINNPVFTPQLIEQSKEPVDHPWFEPGSPPVILAVGRLAKVKDFPTLLYAFAQVSKQIDARLMILGEGDERKRLELLAKKLKINDRLSMPGFVQNPYKYMSRASLLVLSSAWEGFGNVLVESMAVGTPVVSTNCQSGPSEILDDGKYGRLVPVGDSRALAKAIIATLKDPTDPTALLQRAREYSLDRVIEQYVDILNK